MREDKQLGIRRTRSRLLCGARRSASWFAILALSIGSRNQSIGCDGQIIGIGDVVDESTCYDDLYEADADKDGWLNRTEFVTFVNLQSDYYFSEANGDFAALPTLVQRVFKKSATCRDCVVGGCCEQEDKSVNVQGTGPNGRPSTLQTVQLFTICSNAFATLETVMTPSPTPAPSEIASTVPSPSPNNTPSPSQTPSAVFVAPPFAQEPRISTTTLSPSAITFIALAAAAVGVVTMGIVYRQHGSRKRKRGQELVMQSPPKPPQAPPSNTLGASSPHYGPGASGSKVAPVALFPVLSDEECSDSKHSMDDLESQTSSSNAGSSGWSSSAGVSSMNTASVDSLERDLLLGGTLATIGLYSGSVSRLATNTSALQYVPEEESETLDLDSLTSGSTDQLLSISPSVTRADLDHAIEAGDWAAVGATAALLASASGSLSSPTKSVDLSSRGSHSQLSSIDAVRASELDRLVDTGNWEGVVLAAAKFEATNDADPDAVNSGFSDIIPSKTDSKSATDLSILSNSASSMNSPQSTGSGASAGLSNSQTQAEIRSEVEALVKRVVPDEIDNVDEMMTQFKGREDELIETLRTMQERSIAQRARTAMHKNAKREARKSRSEKTSSSSSGFPPRPPMAAQNVKPDTAAAGLGPAAALTTAGVLAATAIASNKSSQDSVSVSSEPREKPLTSSQSSVNSRASKDVTRSALELAIEAGDWEAVGEAAAMMSDASVTTASESTLQLQQLVDAEYDTSTDYETCTSKGTNDSIKSMNLHRAAELDRLIDQGDWSGVVTAASRFSSLDAMVKRKEDETKDKNHPSWKITSSGASITSNDGDTFHSSTPSLTSKEKALQEEHDALAQAEIWMAIAAQSKQETEASGASDAADWAISRSLVALNNADLQQQSTKKVLNQETSEYNTKNVTSEEDKSV